MQHCAVISATAELLLRNCMLDDVAGMRSELGLLSYAVLLSDRVRHLRMMLLDILRIGV